MGLSERKIWLDGELVPWGQATMHVLSQSAQRGSLVFDVMPCYWNGPEAFILGLKEHVARFENSAKLSGMQLAPSGAEIVNAISETVRANPECQVVKISAYYPGIAMDVLAIDPHPAIAIAAFSILDVMKPSGGTVGAPAKLQIADPRKMPPWVMSPQAKLAAGYLYTSIAKRIARADGFDDVLLLDEKGNVAESSTQSFFLVADGALLTATTDTVLAGITRRVVLELAKDEGVPLHEGAIPGEKLWSAEEAFMAGTTTNVWPVGKIDDRSFDPVPGPITARLKDRFTAMTLGNDAVFSKRWMQKVG